jgi:hypothetical protein
VRGLYRESEHFESAPHPARTSGPCHPLPVNREREEALNSASIARMSIDRIFYAYMGLAGIAAGALLVAAPQLQDFWIKPYF